MCAWTDEPAPGDGEPRNRKIMFSFGNSNLVGSKPSFSVYRALGPHHPRFRISVDWGSGSGVHFYPLQTILSLGQDAVLCCHLPLMSAESQRAGAESLRRNARSRWECARAKAAAWEGRHDPGLAPSPPPTFTARRSALPARAGLFPRARELCC